MERVLLVAALAATALVVGLIAQRLKTRTSASSEVSGRVDGAYRVPSHLDRADFADPEKPWLVAVFSSATCSGCESTLEAARHLSSDHVGVEDIEVAEHKDLHDRYGIDAVPTTLIVDAEGDVRHGFLGPVATGDLWGAVADLREGETDEG